MGKWKMGILLHNGPLWKGVKKPRKENQVHPSPLCEVCTMQKLSLGSSLINNLAPFCNELKPDVIVRGLSNCTCEGANSSKSDPITTSLPVHSVARSFRFVATLISQDAMCPLLNSQ